MSGNLDFTQVLIAKFCHDLAGTIGAVSNSIDFLMESNEETRAKAVKILTDGAKHSIANLRFFREAYGVSNNEGEADFKTIKELCSDFLACSNKISLDFRYKNSHQPEIFINKGAGKVILCIVLIASSTLLRGGVIKVEVDKNSSGSKIVISAKGASLKVNELHHDILYGRPASPSVSTLNVHCYYARMLIEQMGASLTIRSDTDKVEYVIE